MKALDEINEEIKTLRNLLYFLNHEVFAQLYKAEQNKTEIDTLIANRDLISVKSWIDFRRNQNINTMTLIDLRQTARGLGVNKADRFNKNQLISMILDRRKKL